MDQTQQCMDSAKTMDTSTYKLAHLLSELQGNPSTEKQKEIFHNICSDDLDCTNVSLKRITKVMLLYTDSKNELSSDAVLARKSAVKQWRKMKKLAKVHATKYQAKLELHNACVQSLQDECDLYKTSIEKAKTPLKILFKLDQLTFNTLEAKEEWLKSSIPYESTHDMTNTELEELEEKLDSAHHPKIKKLEDDLCGYNDRMEQMKMSMKILAKAGKLARHAKKAEEEWWKCKTEENKRVRDKKKAELMDFKERVSVSLIADEFRNLPLESSFPYPLDEYTVEITEPESDTDQPADSSNSD